MENCPSSITPIITEDLCQGKQSSTNCLIFPNAITYLNLPPNSTATVVIQALLLSLIDARARLTEAEERIEDHEIRITALENA